MIREVTPLIRWFPDSMRCDVLGHKVQCSTCTFFGIFFDDVESYLISKSRVLSRGQSSCRILRNFSAAVSPKLKNLLPASVFCIDSVIHVFTSVHHIIGKAEV